jgi:hypothetical protein
VILESAALRVTINPRVGGTITRIEHRALGLDVMGTVPWDPVDAPMEPAEARDEPSWLTRYTGGWPLLFPNAGDACVFEGVAHGFHGEASITPWRAETSRAAIRLTRRFATVPVHMTRIVTLEADVVAVRETAEVLGERPVEVMWGHHPTFGADLLDGDFEIRSGAGTVTVDLPYDPQGNPLQPGATGKWPLVPGKAGPFDLSRPQRNAAKITALAYLHDFDGAWISLRRMDDAVAVALSWDAAIFPCAWLWFDFGAVADPPWNGKTRLIALEPNTTRFGWGLAEAKRQGARLLTLRPGAPLTTTVRLHVFRPAGPVAAVDREGRAIPEIISTACPRTR